MTLAGGLEASVAPMEGVTIFPTRLWLHLASQPRAMTTPFLRVTAVAPADELPSAYAPELRELRGALPYELTPQLLGGDVEHLVRAAALLPPTLAPVVELNCGCPSPNSVGRHAGSGLLREPATFGATLRRLAAELGPGRLAVKMRLGIEAPEELEALLAELPGLPLARLTVHGRTRLQGYRGTARWDRIETAARSVAAPTLASGDVLGLATAARLGDEAPSTRGVLIGRGALRNPWVFEELRRGRPVTIAAAGLAHAVLAFALLHEAWLTQPAKLLARVASGRLGAPVGTDDGAWQALVASLATLVGGVPRVLTPGSGGGGTALPVSPTTVGRVRFLWAHLRTGLPEPLGDPALTKAKRLDDFFARYFSLVAGSTRLELGHRPAWDEAFASARGA